MIYDVTTDFGDLSPQEVAWRGANHALYLLRLAWPTPIFRLW